MSKRTYRHVLVLPSQHLVRPAGDDDFATYRNARIDMCLCYQVDDCCVLQLMMTLLCAIQPHEISEGESPYHPRPLPHHAHTHTHTHTHTGTLGIVHLDAGVCICLEISPWNMNAFVLLK